MSGPSLRSSAAPTKGLPSTPTHSPSLAIKQVNNDTALTVKVLEDHLTKQAESMRLGFAEEISKMRSEFLLKFDEIIESWCHRFDEVNKTISRIAERLDQFEEGTNTAMELHNAEIIALQQRVNALERKEIACDAVLFGVPMVPDENLKSLFNRLCHSIACKPPTLVNIFRSKNPNKNNNNNSTATPPIVLKFSNSQERNAVLISAANFRKQNASELRLVDLGIDSGNSCYFNESLTRQTRFLLNSALRLKRKKQLFSVFTKYGLVYAKKVVNGKSFLIESSEDLLAAAATHQ